jgi:sugar lactone lactonase YvrE
MEQDLRIRFDASGFSLIVAVALTLLAMIGCGSSSSSSSDSGSGQTKDSKLLVADFYNNRVVIFDSPFSAEESATTVLGQADFMASIQATTASGLAGPLSAVMDAQGNIWVSDVRNNRVLRYGSPFTNGMAADLVLGQMSFTTGEMSTSMSGLSLPHGLVFDKNGNLWVADSYNARVLEFSPPFTNAMSASLALGQPPFISGVCSGTPSASSLCFPTGLTFDADGDLWVTDYDENRVLEFKPPFVTGQSASVVLGQQDFTSRIQGAGAAGISLPFSAGFDKSGNLWITDSDNWRVLEFTAPFSNGQAANLVLGYPDFTSTVNKNLQSSMSTPLGLTFDQSGNLFVVDSGDSRVLIFVPPFSNGMNATGVIGQPNLTTVGATTSPPTASGLANPAGISLSH